MDLGRRIKEQRGLQGWSQDTLAEKMFVSRQTISNWENEKSYPDIQSLLLMSNLFNVSIDTLVKGDIDKMEEIINKQDSENMMRYGRYMGVCMVAMVVRTPIMYARFGIGGMLPVVGLWLVAMYYALKIEKIKKENNVQTYREIVAFCNGTRLDEITKQREIGKRPYQRVAMAVAAGVVAFIACALVAMLVGLVF